MQLNSEHDARKRKRKQDREANRQAELEEDEDESLFVPAGGDGVHAVMMSDEDDFTPAAQPHRGVRPKPFKSHLSKDVEEDSMNVILEEIAIRGKRKRGTVPRARKSKDKSKTKGKSQKTISKGKEKVQGPNTRVTKKGKTDKRLKHLSRQVQPNLMDLGSLWTGNVIRDARGNENAPKLPAMTSGKKYEALKRLVASVPQENRKMASIDRNYLLAATRDFIGRGSCRAAKTGDDGWQLKGMKSHLKHHQLLGSAFMRRRERGDEEPRGGLCADQMGLGSKSTP
jgi:hypothetical protein